MLQKAGIALVANERYNRLDTSVTGQVLRLKAAAPDAVLVAGVAAGAALPQMQLARCRLCRQGLPDSRRGDRRLHPDRRPQGRGRDHGGEPDARAGPDSGQRTVEAVAAVYVADYEKLYGAKPATFGANVYDAGLLLQRAIPEALRKGMPGTPEFRAALRDALEATKELVATQGVYNMTPADHSGFDRRGRVLLTIRDGKWVLLGG